MASLVVQKSVGMPTSSTSGRLACHVNYVYAVSNASLGELPKFSMR